MKNLLSEALKEGVENYIVEVILQNEGNVLLLEKPLGVEGGGRYELPSSPVKKGEALSQAIQRTVMDHTTLTLQSINTFLVHFDLEMQKKRQRKFIFVATPEEPFALETKTHIAYAWVSPEESSRYPISNELRETLDLFSRWKKG